METIKYLSTLEDEHKAHALSQESKSKDQYLGFVGASALCKVRLKRWINIKTSWGWAGQSSAQTETGTLFFFHCNIAKNIKASHSISTWINLIE